MKKIALLVILVIVILGFITVGTGLYLDLMWFEVLDLANVFWVQIYTSWALRLVAWALFFMFLFINLMFTRKQVLNLPNINLELREKLFSSGYLKFLTPKFVTLLFLLGSALLSYTFTSYAGNHWMEFLQFLNGSSFGLSDPIFGQDVSVYVFQMPFYRFVYGYLMMVLVTTLLFILAINFFFRPWDTSQKNFIFALTPSGVAHVSLLASLIFLLKSVDYRLQMWELLISPRGFVFGAGYTDINIDLKAMWVLLFLSLLVSILFILNIFMRKSRLLIGGVVAMLVVSILGRAIIPGLVQNFIVQPSEFTHEKPYMEHNIEFTRQAYGLDKFVTQDYPARGDLTWDDIEANMGTFNNIRLWDYRPLRNTFNELQAIRPYYRFVDVDVDRYQIGDDYRQVMLSARELDTRRLDERAQTWVNQKLQYTHGYGVVMSPVNEVNREGLPQYFVRDVPPVTSEGIELDQPAIYFGELASDYIITNTRMKEFDYPMGDENVFTEYEGTGGVIMGGLLKRALFALRFADYRILFSGEVQPDSRIHFYRNISQRLNKLAPFLIYDEDPYVVVHDGRIFWIQDAYTTTNRYPYSQPQGSINYIRNSVKVVIDAYNGDVAMYVIEPDDPIIQTYSLIFPDLFQPIEDMPEGLINHIRYPEGLFMTQARVYTLYHVTDPNIFYNREDIWEFPTEQYAGEEQFVEPYYNILQLPGEEDVEFVLIQPLTPIRRNNMIAWLAARCDGEHYGEMMVFQFPKDRVIFGPQQIENRIDQSTEISEQLTLWDQSGSRVIRGNLLVLPVNDSIIYVEPVFLEADAGGLPELVRVIVAFDEQVIMERTLEEGLRRILGERVDTVPGEPDPVPDPDRDEDTRPDEDRPPVTDRNLDQLVQDAGRAFDDAHQRLRDGDWQGYGDKMDELEDILRQLEGFID